MNDHAALLGGDDVGALLISAEAAAGLAVLLDAGLALESDPLPASVAAAVDAIQHLSRAYRASRARGSVAKTPTSVAKTPTLGRDASTSVILRSMGSADAARELNCSARTVQRLVDAGGLRGTLVAGRLVIDADSVAAMKATA